VCVEAHVGVCVDAHVWACVDAHVCGCVDAHVCGCVAAHVWLCGRTVLRTSATALSTWSLAPLMVMVRSGSEGVSSERDWTRMEAPESLMKSRTVWPL
jgi:hypothetical protein